MIFKSIKLAESQNFHNRVSTTGVRNRRDVACNFSARRYNIREALRFLLRASKIRNF
ncbi:MAG: hypothetical protein LBG92_07900 [Prevotellaceae bacterium]|nr:hypothetical protein [Prevotellaceae bacterium]